MRAIYFSLGLIVLLSLPAQAELAKEMAEAARAIDDGVPEVAVARLKKIVPHATGKEEEEAKERLAEALVAAGQPEEALRLLAEPKLSAAAKFLRAQALADSGSFEAALAVYRDVARDTHDPYQLAASFGAAEMLRTLGQTEEAIREYRKLENDSRFGVSARLRQAELFIIKRDGGAAKRLLDSVQPKETADKREKRFLRARLDLLNRKPAEAAGSLESIAKKTEGESHETVVAALFALADAHLQLNTPEAGDDYLEDFIDRHPSDPDLPRIFEKLDQLYRAERRLPRTELEKWARDPTQPRDGLARWYLAQAELRGGRRDTALEQFEQIRKATNPALAPALLQYARLELESGRADLAQQILEDASRGRPSADVQHRIDFMAARAAHARGEFQDAGKRFENIAKIAPALTKPALLNASFGWLRAGETERLAADTKALSQTGAGSAVAEVSLEKSLAAAKANDPQASALLRDFLRRFPNAARAAEAHLALAEIDYHAAPPKLEEAGQELSATRNSHPSEEINERADYLGVWLADTRAGDGDPVITAANDFLEKHPASSFAPEVRMKLAETYFRRQDFANAQTRFELLARQAPDSPLIEKALFLAAQSATSSMAANALNHALELLAQVVKMNGDLRWAARNEQALIERRLGKLAEAQLLYDEVLKSDARGADKREALCGKADIFLEEAGPDNLQHAVALYDQLATEAANQPHWRNQALFKKGVCLEKNADADGALSTFYQVLDFNPQPDKAPEFFWYYKAGFNAARLLEERQKWESAAAIYEKLAAANGPRSEEAKERLNQLRLEHFLWQK